VTDELLVAAFEALLSRTGSDLLILTDERLRILRAGRVAAGLAERPAASLVGMSLIAAFGSAPLDAIARTALTEGRDTSGDADLGRLGSRQFAIDAVTLGGRGLVLALHDISALRRMERVRRDFIANLSHELRTPLASIKLLAETLSSGAVDDPATMRDFSTQIEREIDHLAQMVDELLDLSTIESGAIQVHLEAIDPDDVVTSGIERIAPVAERSGVRLQRHGSTAAGEVRVDGDANRLSQALLNLAHNAVKFSRPGGEVRIGWEVVDGAVRFSVADDGIGIPESHQARIFERFYKVDRSRAREPAGEALSGSAGLGLAIVRHIAEAHGGRAGVESIEGVGSTFWIEIPLATEGEHDRPGIASSASLDSGA
jgi:two-component system, OmpR family, phosphate regulon sensor histidine kinase PhoR